MHLKSGSDRSETSFRRSKGQEWKWPVSKEIEKIKWDFCCRNGCRFSTGKTVTINTWWQTQLWLLVWIYPCCLWEGLFWLRLPVWCGPCECYSKALQCTGVLTVSEMWMQWWRCVRCKPSYFVSSAGRPHPWVHRQLLWGAWYPKRTSTGIYSQNRCIPCLAYETVHRDIFVPHHCTLLTVKSPWS